MLIFQALLAQVYDKHFLQKTMADKIVSPSCYIYLIYVPETLKKLHLKNSKC